jgi:hypothetical protein
MRSRYSIRIVYDSLQMRGMQETRFRSNGVISGDWRGAASARAQGSRIFFPVRGRPKRWLKRAAPTNPSAMFCPEVSSIVPFRTARDKPRVGSFEGAACCDGLESSNALRRISGGRRGTRQNGSPSSPFCPRPRFNLTPHQICNR